MEPTRLLECPEEIIHHICEFLSVKDILACSQTCHYLRSTLNENTVWKRFLPEEITELETLETNVQSPFCLENTLTPLCDNRVSYIRKTRLINCWRNDAFVEYSKEMHYSYVSAVFHIPKGKGQVFYQGKYLFLGRFTNDVHSDQIEVWDLTKQPILYTHLKITNLEYDSFYVIDSLLVVVECFRVDVYSINLPKKDLPLLYSFSVTEEDISWHVRANHVGEHDSRCVGWSHGRIDKYIVFNKCESADDSNVIHVWDIPNVCKVGTFVTPIPGFSVHTISHENNDWILRQTKQCGNDQFLLKFNIKKQEFSDVIFKYTDYADHVIFYKDHVIIFSSAEPDAGGWCDTLCTVYDFKTSAKISERQFENSHNNYKIESTIVLDGKFVLLCDYCFLTIDALSLETVDSFTYDIHVKFITHHLSLYGSIFVIACDSSNVLYIWDIKKQRILPKSLESAYTSLLCFNKSLSKIVCIDYWTLSIKHFW